MRSLAALLLLSLSMSGCVEDIISQADALLYRVANTGSRPDAITGRRSLNFTSRDAEIRSSERRVREIIRNPEKIGARPGARRVSPFDPRYERLARVFHRVVSASHAADEIERSVRFVYFDDPLWHAAALGGNKMVFFTGLTEDLDDDELAAVIGHEMAHNAASRISDRASSKTIISLAGGRTDREGRHAAYTLKEEKEADEIGILYAALAGYDPYAASRFWARGPGRGHAYFRTHPTGPRRARRARRIADKARRYYVPGQLNPRVREILACNELYCRRGKSGESAASPAPGEKKKDALSAAIDSLAFGWLDKWEIRDAIRTERKKIKRHNKRLLSTAPRLRFASGWLGFRGICEGRGRDEGVAAGFRGEEGFMHGSRLKRTELKLDGRDSRGSWYLWRRGRSEGLLLVKFLSKGTGFTAEWFSRDGAILAKCRAYRRD